MFSTMASRRRSGKDWRSCGRSALPNMLSRTIPTRRQTMIPRNHDRRRISPKELAAKGWIPLGGRSYRHKDGVWVIEHCGHPTALYPYALYRATGDGMMSMVLNVNGHAWHTV